MNGNKNIFSMLITDSIKFYNKKYKNKILLYNNCEFSFIGKLTIIIQGQLNRIKGHQLTIRGSKEQMEGHQ